MFPTFPPPLNGGQFTPWQSLTYFSLFLSLAAKNFTIKHSNGLCVSYRPSDGVLRLASSCDLFQREPSGTLWHMQSGKCVIPKSNSRGARLTLTSKCNNLNARFHNSNLWHFPTATCLRPEQGDIDPRPDTNIVLLPNPGCQDIRYHFHLSFGKHPSCFVAKICEPRLLGESQILCFHTLTPTPNS